MEDFGVHTLLVSPLKNEAIRNNPEMVERLMKAGIRILYDSCRAGVGR